MIFQSILIKIEDIFNKIIDPVKTKIHTVTIFNYNIGNIRYKCFGLKEVEDINGKKKLLNIMLEVKNFKKRNFTINPNSDMVNFNKRYVVGEVTASFKDIENMGEIFKDWLNHHKSYYIKICPYGDMPAKRMRIFDRLLVQAGYNIICLKKSNYKNINIFKRIYSPRTIYYSKNKEEWIDREEYETWLKETLKLERP